MSDLKVGDTVFDVQGQTCHVTGVSEIHHRRCFELRFDDNSILIADDEHRWFTQTNSERQQAVRRTEEFRGRRKAMRPSRAKANPIKPGVQKSISALNRSREYIYLEPSQGEVRDTLQILNTMRTGKAGRANHSISTATALILPDAVLSVDPYTLGLWLGGGSKSSGHIGMLETDLNELQPYIPFAIKSQRVYGPPKYNKPFKTVSFNGLREALRTIGVLSNKHIPLEYFRGSVAQRLALLAGMMDTGGHAALDGGCEFDNTNVKLAEGVYELLVSLGIKATLQQCRAKLYGRDMGPRWRVKFTTAMPVFRLRRKLARQRVAARAAATRRYIVDIKEIPSVPTRCISVDSPSRQYLAGKSMIPTHNTAALLAAALQYADCPNYHALIVRRTYATLAMPGAIMELAQRWLGPTDARWRDGNHWEFPAGATLNFGYLARDNDKYQFGSANYNYIAIDEAAEFPQEDTYRFMFSRIRRGRGVTIPGRMRLGANPIGPGAMWLKKRFITDPNAEELQYHPCPLCDPHFHWKEPCTETGCACAWNPNSEPRLFIPSKLSDNPYLDAREYKRMLSQLSNYERQALLSGDWDAKMPGKMFQRQWFRIVSHIHNSQWTQRVRFWDLAATQSNGQNNPSYSCGVKMSYDQGLFIVEDVVRVRETPGKVKQIVKKTAEMDGTAVPIWIEQEPGSSGIFVIEEYKKYLPAWVVQEFKISGSKEMRAAPFASQAEGVDGREGNVALLHAPWNEAYIEELEQFPSTTVKNDQVDGSSGAYQVLAVNRQFEPEEVGAYGERVSPDWHFG